MPETVSASVPDPVIGDPPTEMMPPVKVWATLVTVPVPAASCHEPSPRRNVLALAVPVADIPLTGRVLAVVPERLMDVGVPPAPLNKTGEPVDPVAILIASKTPAP